MHLLCSLVSLFLCFSARAHPSYIPFTTGSAATAATDQSSPTNATEGNTTVDENSAEMDMDSDKRDGGGGEEICDFVPDDPFCDSPLPPSPSPEFPPSPTIFRSPRYTGDNVVSFKYAVLEASAIAMEAKEEMITEDEIALEDNSTRISTGIVKDHAIIYQRESADDVDLNQTDSTSDNDRSNEAGRIVNVEGQRRNAAKPGSSSRKSISLSQPKSKPSSSYHENYYWDSYEYYEYYDYTTTTYNQKTPSVNVHQYEALPPVHNPFDRHEQDYIDR